MGGISPDSTEASSVLREKEAFNFALFQYNPAPIVIVDGNGLVVKSNLARRHSKQGLPPLGEPLFNADPGSREDELQRTLVRCIHSGDVQHFPEEAIGKRILAVTMAPFPEGAIVTTEDITEQKLALEQLMHADKMVALGTLVSGVAHEVSNPNNAMLLSASLLQKLWVDILPVLDRVLEQEGDFALGRRAYSEVRDELPDMVDVIERAAQRIKTMVNDLKTFARKGSDTLDESVDMNAVLDASAGLLASLIKKTTDNFSKKQAESLPPVAGNAQRLEQVVVNLLTNACQALPGRTSAIVAETWYDPDTSQVVLAVRDEGKGISVENLERITDPFFTTRHDDGGTGLGLSISHTIIENHKGKLKFESEPGKGTVATIRLPTRNE